VPFAWHISNYATQISRAMFPGGASEECVEAWFYQKASVPRSALVATAASTADPPGANLCAGLSEHLAGSDDPLLADGHGATVVAFKISKSLGEQRSAGQAA